MIVDNVISKENEKHKEGDGENRKKREKRKREIGKARREKGK